MPIKQYHAERRLAANNTSIYFQLVITEKCCPKNIFLSLISACLVKGIPSGQYTKSKKLKEALAILELPRNPNSAELNDRQVWNLIKPGCTYNSEVAVVRALFIEDLIE